MQISIDQTYRFAQNLSRGLCVLRALNEVDGNSATPREISERTSINRTTVKRILETLVLEGYVRFFSADGSYGLSASVKGLSKGYTEESRVLQAASPVINKITEATGLSLRITCPKMYGMAVRDTTHAHSSLSSEFTVGLRHSIPMLLTAAGRAYFSNCSMSDQARMVRGISVAGDNQSPLARNPRLVEQLVARVHDDGYAMNDGDWGERRLGAVAVPIRGRTGKVLASLSMIYPRGAVSRMNIEGEFIPTLFSGARSIEESLAPA